MASGALLRDARRGELVPNDPSVCEWACQGSPKPYERLQEIAQFPTPT